MGLSSDLVSLPVKSKKTVPDSERTVRIKGVNLCTTLKAISYTCGVTLQCQRASQPGQPPPCDTLVPVGVSAVSAMLCLPQLHY